MAKTDPNQPVSKIPPKLYPLQKKGAIWRGENMCNICVIKSLERLTKILLH